ncbi:hypothetical protein Shyhy02_79770 [Streptomyces hygroscopicus subsp. hygroscopicus]|nr:hypothetical protein Shyhy02_79770 [Streptomyces hygroscopicus subsp. hygroscopicus]
MSDPEGGAESAPPWNEPDRKEAAMGMMDKLKDAISKNPQKARRGARKGSETADKKTGGAYSEQIQTGSDKIDDELRRRGEGPREQ